MAYSTSCRIGVLSSLLACSCDWGLRDPDASFEEKTCGSTLVTRDPSPEITPVGRVLSGSARRLSDGTVEVVIAPLVETATGTIEAVLDRESMQIEISGEVVTEFELEPVDANEYRAPVDIVFVLDTTGSMAWAINGVHEGIHAFLDGLEESGIDARVGGIEFGDEVRTQTPVGNGSALRTWLDKLTAIGGGDQPESPLDAMEEAWASFEFRPGALRYFVVITDEGLHEETDGSECSETTLATTTSLMKGELMLTVVHAKLGDPLGVHPRWLTRSLGGLHVEIDALAAAVSFDISSDTPADDVLESTHVLRIPAGAAPTSGDSVSLRYTLGGESVSASFAIE